MDRCEYTHEPTLGTRQAVYAMAATSSDKIAGSFKGFGINGSVVGGYLAGIL